MKLCCLNSLRPVPKPRRHWPASHLVETPTATHDVSPFTATIQCERGTAKLRGTQEITWTHAEDQRTELLEGERDGMVVLLDLFCRRVMGGLVPIPTIDDLITSARLAKET